LALGSSVFPLSPTPSTKAGQLQDIEMSGPTRPGSPSGEYRNVPPVCRFATASATRSQGASCQPTFPGSCRNVSVPCASFVRAVSSDRRNAPQPAVDRAPAGSSSKRMTSADTIGRGDPGAQSGHCYTLDRSVFASRPSRYICNRGSCARWRTSRYGKKHNRASDS
jgi:hypothetical protein